MRDQTFMIITQKGGDEVFKIAACCRVKKNSHFFVDDVTVWSLILRKYLSQSLFFNKVAGWGL